MLACHLDTSENPATANWVDVIQHLVLMWCRCRLFSTLWVRKHRHAISSDFDQVTCAKHLCIGDLFFQMRWMGSSPASPCFLLPTFPVITGSFVHAIILYMLPSCWENLGDWHCQWVCVGTIWYAARQTGNMSKDTGVQDEKRMHPNPSIHNAVCRNWLCIKAVSMSCHAAALALPHHQWNQHRTAVFIVHSQALIWNTNLAL